MVSVLTNFKFFDKIRNNESPERYYLQRKSLQKQFTTQRLTIVVPGNSSLRLLDVLNFELPKSGYMSDTETDWQDKLISGKYVVLSLKTTINRLSGYRTTVEMSKDSLVGAIPSRYDSSPIPS